LAAQGLQPPHLAAHGLQAPHLAAQGLQAPQVCAAHGLQAVASVCAQPAAIKPTPSTNGMTVVLSSLLLGVPIIASFSSHSTSFPGGTLVFGTVHTREH
jgi:hypothetical protein